MIPSLENHRLLKEIPLFSIGIVVLFFLLVAATRFMPHPPNFTPLTSMALVAGVILPRRSFAWIVPLLILIITDFFIGFHSTWLSVYGSFLLIGLIGTFLGPTPNMGSTVTAILGSGLLFFLITNLQVFFVTDFYEKSLYGLMACYAAGLPFYRNMLMGDLIFGVIFFAPVFWAKYKIESQKKAQA